MCELRELSSVLAKKAAIELNENPANTSYYLNAFREWVQQQPHLRARTTDQFLIVFLRAAKFSLEKAKQKLDNFYTYRATMPELFSGRNFDDPKIYGIIKAGCLLHLPDPVADDGPRVVMIRPACFDLEKHTIPDVFKVGAMATDILLYEDDNAIIAGYVLIMDLTNIPNSVIFNFSVGFAKKLTILANKINPTRMKGFHFLNVPTVFEKLFNMVKCVINEKLRSRFFVHGNNIETLYEHVPKHILPKEYGGDCDITAMQEQWLRRLEEQKEFLAEEESFGIISRPSDFCTNNKVANETIFGIEGSFRKINID